MYFWTLPGPEGAVLGGAAVAVETNLTMGCTLGTVVVTGEVVVEPEPGAEVLRDRTWGKNGKSVSVILHPHYSPSLGEYLTCSNQIINPLIHPQEEKLWPSGPLGSAPSSSCFGPRGDWALLWGLSGQHGDMLPITPGPIGLYIPVEWMRH